MEKSMPQRRSKFNSGGRQTCQTLVFGDSRSDQTCEQPNGLVYRSSKESYTTPERPKQETTQKVKYCWIEFGLQSWSAKVIGPCLVLFTPYLFNANRYTWTPYFLVLVGSFKITSHSHLQWLQFFSWLAHSVASVFFFMVAFSIRSLWLLS